MKLNTKDNIETLIFKYQINLQYIYKQIEVQKRIKINNNIKQKIYNK